MRTLELTEEQKKTLKLFSYYCGSYGAKTATLTVYLAENGSVDWQDDYWYSDSITGWHREYSTDDSYKEWNDEDGDFGDLKEDFDRFFEQMGGENGRLGFDGSGDSGQLHDNIELSSGQSMDIPSFIEEWCYDMLGHHFGGWEINEGSQGSFYFHSPKKSVTLDFEQNIEDDMSDGVVGYVEF